MPRNVRTRSFVCVFTNFIWMKMHYHSVPNRDTNSASKLLVPDTLLKEDAFDESVAHEELASDAPSPLGRALLVVSKRASPIWLKGTVSTTGGGMPLLSLATEVKSVCVSIARKMLGCVKWLTNVCAGNAAMRAHTICRCNRSCSGESCHT